MKTKQSWTTVCSYMTSLNLDNMRLWWEHDQMLQTAVHFHINYMSNSWSVRIIEHDLSWYLIWIRFCKNIITTHRNYCNISPSNSQRRAYHFPETEHWPSPICFKDKTIRNDPLSSYEVLMSCTIEMEKRSYLTICCLILVNIKKYLLLVRWNNHSLVKLTLIHLDPWLSMTTDIIIWHQYHFRPAWSQILTMPLYWIELFQQKFRIDMMTRCDDCHHDFILQRDGVNTYVVLQRAPSWTNVTIPEITVFLSRWQTNLLCLRVSISYWNHNVIEKKNVSRL